MMKVLCLGFCSWLAMWKYQINFHRFRIGDGRYADYQRKSYCIIKAITSWCWVK